MRAGGPSNKVETFGGQTVGGRCNHKSERILGNPYPPPSRAGFRRAIFLIQSYDKTSTFSPISVEPIFKEAGCTHYMY